MAKKQKINLNNVPAPVYEIKSEAVKIKFTKLDLMLLLPLLIVYAFLAFYHLGNNNTPQSYHVFSYGEGVVLDIGETKMINELIIFQGQTAPKYKISISADNVNFEQVAEFAKGYVFQWVDQSISKEARYIKVINILGDKDAFIHEFIITDNEGNIIPIKAALDFGGNDLKELYDEPNKPDGPGYMHSTYFDEIYHPRTSFENLHGIEPTETSHPPLGKIIIAIGIKIFGMTPFGWRFMGTIFGIIMVAAMYFLGRQVFKKEWYAFFTAFLMTFDFMHITQTRLATIDSYSVVFIIIMYMFMFKFLETNFLVDDLRVCLRPLFWSGLFFGIGAATKWICIYAGIGLFILFCINIVLRIVDYNRAHENKYKHDKLAGQIKKIFYERLFKVFGFAALFFILIPACVYILSYIPFIFVKGNSYTLKQVFSYQKFMFDYHSKLTATHPYSSNWYQWPTMIRPIWYFFQNNADTGTISTISAFGNPAIWWTGILATFASCFIALFKRDKIVLFIMISYFSQIVPWIGINRVIFIYHYFASVPFVILLIVYFMKSIYEHATRNKEAIIEGKVKVSRAIIALRASAGVYLALVLVLFIMFFPVLTGEPTTKEYVSKYLKWMKSWVFFN